MKNLTNKEWPEKKRAIVAATINTVVEKGLNGATTALIARKAAVGEGTIYRYFENKEELITTGATFCSELIFSKPRQNYDPELSVHSQFDQFCHDYLSSGSKVVEYHMFMEQFVNSPQGVAYRKKTLKNLETDPDLKPLIFPINKIINDGLKQGILKELPLVLLIGLIMAPLTITVKHAAQGFFELKKEYISVVSHACWSAIRK